MKVYGHPLSSCTRKVLVTLAEKAAAADFAPVDSLRRRAQGGGPGGPFARPRARDGDAFSLADISLMPYVCASDHRGRPRWRPSGRGAPARSGTSLILLGSGYRPLRRLVMRVLGALGFVAVATVIACGGATSVSHWRRRRYVGGRGKEAAVEARAAARARVRRAAVARAARAAEPAARAAARAAAPRDRAAAWWTSGAASRAFRPGRRAASRRTGVSPPARTAPRARARTTSASSAPQPPTARHPRCAASAATPTSRPARPGASTAVSSSAIRTRPAAAAPRAPSASRAGSTASRAASAPAAAADPAARGRHVR